jgi:nicotinate-nucleotide pyrophosphorylase
MKNFIVEIKEILLKTIEIECDSKDDALEFIKSQYGNENIVLDNNDFIDVEFTIKKND